MDRLRAMLDGRALAFAAVAGVAAAGIVQRHGTANVLADRVRDLVDVPTLDALATFAVLVRQHPSPTKRQLATIRAHQRALPGQAAVLYDELESAGVPWMLAGAPVNSLFFPVLHDEIGRVFSSGVHPRIFAAWREDALVSAETAWNTLLDAIPLPVLQREFPYVVNLRRLAIASDTVALREYGSPAYRDVLVHHADPRLAPAHRALVAAARCTVSVNLNDAFFAAGDAASNTESTVKLRQAARERCHRRLILRALVSREAR